MPLPQRRNILRSGNTGNSSKASKEKGNEGRPTEAANDLPKKAPLFPFGSKTPLSLLNERYERSEDALAADFKRCQKNGWEKPLVEPRRALGGNGFTCVVTLRRLDKKTSLMETVRMEPHPPLLRATAEEAKHWGSVYALYRFANGIQLQLVLPPEPRQYWHELAEEHKKAVSHLSWQYEADPFAAQKAVADRQKKRENKEKLEQQANSEGLSKDVVRVMKTNAKAFAAAPEVKMALTIRELVERVIKDAMNKQSDQEMCMFSPEALETARVQLLSLGWPKRAVAPVLEYLASAPPLTAYQASLSEMQPLDAALSHLLLTTKEVDLPAEFGAGKAKGGGFVSSTHAGDGSESLKTRWIRERAVKEAGWPEGLVRDAISVHILADWGMLIEVLNRRLVGLDIPPELFDPLELDTGERDSLRQEEIEAIISVFEDAKFDNAELSVVIPGTDIWLHITYPAEHPYPMQPGIIRIPPLYLTSHTVAPIVRLDLLSTALNSLNGEAFADILLSGSGIVFGLVELLGDAWAAAASNEKHDVGIDSLLRLMLPLPKPVEDAPTLIPPPSHSSKSSFRQKTAMDTRSDQDILQCFETTQRREQYQDLLRDRMKLPAWNSQAQIVSLLEQHRLLIVVGETGCGKTTQLPQFILDDLIRSLRGRRASILVTQPRRVAALGVASRVATERCDDGSVGYAVRGDSKWNTKTKILFVTTGVALRRMASDKLEGVTHVIVDEVHERSVDSDFLLLEIRELLKENKTIRVVCMSATIDQQTFANYFGGAPVVEIPGFTHPVQDIYLEDCISTLGFRSPTTSRTKAAASQDDDLTSAFRGLELEDEAIETLHNVLKSNRIEYELVTALVRHICTIASHPKQAILIFMPGVQEIQNTILSLRAANDLRNAVEILPLHANLTADEQRRVFKPMAKRKIVVATNVAETSITISDVAFVIDTGKVKEVSYNAAMGMSCLAEKWISKAAARQRRGRAGRTQPGQCFKLYTRRQEITWDDASIPEMLRVSLDGLLLQVKASRDVGDTNAYLGKALSPPDASTLFQTESVLRGLSALDEQNLITPLGRHMALLPLDVRLSKMLILASLFRCIGPILTVAAILSSKPLFLLANDRREEVKSARSRFLLGNSDLLTDAEAFSRVQSHDRTRRQEFCAHNCISTSSVREIAMLRQDFFNVLASVGFVQIAEGPDGLNFNQHKDNVNVLKSIILGGLWPRTAMVTSPRQLFDRVQAGTVERERESKEFKVFDNSGRVFIHPQSIMFDRLGTHRSPLFVYFNKSQTSKIFLRDVTEVPLYGGLLFGGKVIAEPATGGLRLGDTIIMKAWPRIGVLINQLRRMLDMFLESQFETPTSTQGNLEEPVIGAMLALLEKDGLSH